jgi:hypothetical protein
VRENASVSPVLSTHNAKLKRRLLDRIKKLRSVEDAERAGVDGLIKQFGLPADSLPTDFGQIYSSYYLAQTRRERERLETWANRIVTDSASKPRDPARQAAAALAHKLITDFSNDRPSVTRYGAWHELANKLFGEGANLFKEIREHRWCVMKDRAKADRIDKALCDLLQHINTDRDAFSLYDLFWALH